MNDPMASVVSKIKDTILPKLVWGREGVGPRGTRVWNGLLTEGQAWVTLIAYDKDDNGKPLPGGTHVAGVFVGEVDGRRVVMHLPPGLAIAALSYATVNRSASRSPEASQAITCNTDCQHSEGYCDADRCAACGKPFQPGDRRIGAHVVGGSGSKHYPGCPESLTLRSVRSEARSESTPEHVYDQWQLAAGNGEDLCVVGCPACVAKAPK